MKIEHAIELLQEDLDDSSEEEVPQWRGALSLGIEALKRIHSDRNYLATLKPALLPGEDR